MKKVVSFFGVFFFVTAMSFTLNANDCICTVAQGPQNTGVCLDEGYSSAECFSVSIQGDCSGTWCPPTPIE